MFQRASLIAFAVLCGTSPLLAENVQMPLRKAGLWELTTQITGMPNTTAPPVIIQQCTDENVDRQLNKMSSDMVKCSKQEMTKSGDSYIGDNVCAIGDTTVTSHVETTGDFNSAYSVKTVAKSSDPKVPPEMVTTIQAKWLGACKADQKPGDILMPNGIKMNVTDMQKMKAMQPK